MTSGCRLASQPFFFFFFLFPLRDRIQLEAGGGQQLGIENIQIICVELNAGRSVVNDVDVDHKLACEDAVGKRGRKFQIVICWEDGLWQKIVRSSRDAELFGPVEGVVIDRVGANHHRDDDRAGNQDSNNRS